jgi:hypothetical protein
MDDDWTGSEDIFQSCLSLEQMGMNGQRCSAAFDSLRRWKGGKHPRLKEYEIERDMHIYP